MNRKHNSIKLAKSVILLCIIENGESIVIAIKFVLKDKILQKGNTYLQFKRKIHVCDLRPAMLYVTCRKYLLPFRLFIAPRNKARHDAVLCLIHVRLDCFSSGKEVTVCGNT